MPDIIVHVCNLNTGWGMSTAMSLRTVCATEWIPEQPSLD